MATSTTNSSSTTRTRPPTGSSKPQTTSSTPTTSANATSITPTFSFTHFSDPASSSTIGTGAGGSAVANPGAGGIASSASLYLYTFLATLVLLLSVSAAIILRSLLLRRRHRRMVEEAIRNGTWVPPSPGGSGPFGMGRMGRVDLSKKPVMWEAYVGNSEKDHIYTSVQRPTQTEWEWDTIRPFSATYVGPASSQTNPDGSPADNTATTPPSVPLSHRVIGFFRPRRAPAASTPSTPRRGGSASASATSLPAGASASTDTPAPAPPTPPAKKVRVAVLIAMPHPPTESHDSRSRASSSISGPIASSSSSPSPTALTDEEQELPHIEFGITELEVHDPDHSTSTELGKGVGRSSSVGGSIEV